MYGNSLIPTPEEYEEHVNPHILCELDSCSTCIGTEDHHDTDYEIETASECEYGEYLHAFCCEEHLKKWLATHFSNYEQCFILDNEIEDLDEAQKRLQVYCERLCEWNKKHTNTIKEAFQQYMDNDFDPHCYAITVEADTNDDYCK